MREMLLMEIAHIASSDLAAAWARQAIISKNLLTTADAKHVEDAFEQKLSQLATLAESTATLNSAQSAMIGDQDEPTKKTGNPKQQMRIDKSRLAFPEPRRLRNKEHLRFVARQSCLICGRAPTDAHHIRYAQPRALGRKSSDEFTVPLCRIHHRDVHRTGDEKGWWKQAGIDPMTIAHKLWRQTRGANIRNEAKSTTAEATPETATGQGATRPSRGRDVPMA